MTFFQTAVSRVCVYSLLFGMVLLTVPLYRAI